VNRIGFEPMTPSLEGLCSIQLSYRSIMGAQNNGKILRLTKQNFRSIAHGPSSMDYEPNILTLLQTIAK
jgi:hypothetical protein